MTLLSLQFTCPFCSLFCDDIEITGMDCGSPVLQPGCAKASARLSETLQGLGSMQTSWEQAFDEAVQKLRSAQRPLVLLTGEASCEEAAAGATLAQKTYACVDTRAAVANTIWNQGACSPGMRTCSAESISGRAILAWGIDFDLDFQRFFELFWEGGEKRVFSVNSRLPDQLAACSPYYPDPSLELLVDLNRAIRKLPAGPAASQLASRLVESGSGCILAKADRQADLPFLAELARLGNNLEESTGELWDFFPLCSGSNWNGVQAILEIMTGYPGGIRYRQRPTGCAAEYSPADWAAEKLIDRREVDLLICVGGEIWVGNEQDSSCPVEGIVLSATPPVRKTQTWLPAARAGIHTSGTAMRFDGKPVALAPIIENDRPTLTALLTRLADTL